MEILNIEYSRNEGEFDVQVQCAISPDPETPDFAISLVFFPFTKYI